MNRHDIDAVSFATGVAFLAIAAWWALAHVINFHAPSVGWFVAGALLLFGLLGLLSAMRSDGKRPSGGEP
jgi:hypothetical protein